MSRLCGYGIVLDFDVNKRLVAVHQKLDALHERKRSGENLSSDELKAVAVEWRAAKNFVLDQLHSSPILQEVFALARQHATSSITVDDEGRVSLYAGQAFLKAVREVADRTSGFVVKEFPDDRAQQSLAKQTLSSSVSVVVTTFNQMYVNLSPDEAKACDEIAPVTINTQMGDVDGAFFKAWQHNARTPKA
ncbi:MAG: hypothetical protein EBZ69_08965 [Alphaproteobacteria bacterium]|nr:hypothetical protein [Alphaproteobacteria bacterium]NDC56916.1 hypothetical protein [Alphaproteobacteria bacterium]NDG03859.1 hypothetical protein [Alphaproteobacteria bacterium]